MTSATNVIMTVFIIDGSIDTFSVVYSSAKRLGLNTALR